MSALEIAVEHYDGLYSRFDRRPYRERVVSKELLEDMRIMAKGEKIDTLTIRVAQRDRQLEEGALESLKRSFLIWHRYWQARHRSSLKSALWFFIAAAADVLVYAAIYALWPGAATLIYPLAVILGWVLAWNGFENIIIDEDKETREFFEQISRARIAFDDA